MKYLFLDSKNEETQSSKWIGMIFLKRRYSSEREEEFFFSCEHGCEGEVENPKVLVFGGNKFNDQPDMANCKAGNTCRFVATEEVFKQIDTTTVEMITQMNYVNKSYDYSQDFEVSTYQAAML